MTSPSALSDADLAAAINTRIAWHARRIMRPRKASQIARELTELRTERLRRMAERKAA